VKPEDRKAFLEVVVGFAELKGKQLSAPALQLYWRSLQHWPLDDFRAAAEQLLRTCEFMPLPKDFEDLRKAGRLTVGEAWASVLAWVRSGNFRGLPVLNGGGDPDRPDALAERAVRAIGGYNAIAMSETDKTHFLERRFAEHYDAMQDADEVREELPQIAFTTGRLSGPRSARDLLGGPENPE
jgi:hypothetical protein